MAALAFRRLRQEVDLLERFTRSYRRKVAGLIDQLNREESPTDLQCVRICVEAVDMMLASQSQVMRSLREISLEPSHQQRAA